MRTIQSALSIIVFIILIHAAGMGFGSSTGGFGGSSGKYHPLKAAVRQSTHILLITVLDTTNETLKAKYEVTYKDKQDTVYYSYPLAYVTVDSVLKAPDLPSVSAFRRGSYRVLDKGHKVKLADLTKVKIVGKTLPLISDRDEYHNNALLKANLQGSHGVMMAGYGNPNHVIKDATPGKQYVLIAEKHDDLHLLKGVKEFGFYPLEKCTEIDSLNRAQPKLKFKVK